MLGQTPIAVMRCDTPAAPHSTQAGTLATFGFLARVWGLDMGTVGRSNQQQGAAAVLTLAVVSESEDGGMQGPN